MGLFGGMGKAIGGYFDGPIPWADRLAGAGAALGGDGQTAALIRQHALALVADRHKKAEQDGFYKQLIDRMQPGYQDGPAPNVRMPGLIGGIAAAQGMSGDPTGMMARAGAMQAPQPDQAPPAQFQMPQRTSNGLDINSPDLPSIAMMAARVGVPIKDMLDVMKAQQADMAQSSDGGFYNKHNPALAGTHTANRANVNNTVVDLNDPQNTNRYVPDAPVKGAQPVYDNTGRVVDWRMPQGALDALGSSAEATQRGQTVGTMLRVPLRGGGERLMMGRDYMRGAGGSGSPGGGGGGDLGTSQAPADAAYAAENAKTGAAQYKGIVDVGAQANAKISGFKQIDQLLGNFEGGKLAPAGLDLASAGNSIGFKMDPKMQNAQAADAISKQLVLSLSGGSLGTGFSNADRDFMTAQVPSILQSAGGRRQLVSIGIATAQRQQDVAAKARAWQDRFGRIDAPDGNGKHFQDQLDRWANAHPVFAPRK